MERSAAKLTKRALAAREYEDLQVVRLTMERVEHKLDPVVVGEDEGIVKDHRRVPSTLGQHSRESEPNQQGDLFTRPAGKDLDRLLLPVADECVRQQRVIPPGQLCIWPQQLEKRLQFGSDRREIPLSGLAACRVQCLFQPLENPDLMLDVSELDLRSFQRLLGFRKALLHRFA